MPEVTCSLGEALGLQLEVTDRDLAGRVADRVALAFSQLDWSTDLGDCGIPSSDAPKILGFVLRNYNANHDRQLDRHTDTLLACIARTIAPR